MPVIAAVRGHCLGGGLQIALAADFRVTTPDSTWSVLEAKWGIIPDMSGIQALSQQVGMDVAKRLTMTGAAYRIEQSNILTRDPTNPQQAVQGGEQSSQGVELSIGAAVTDALSLSAGAAYTDANYDQLSELIAGARIDRAGNRPINTPSTTVSGSALYTVKALPVTLGGFVRLLGEEDRPTRVAWPRRAPANA